MLGLDVGLFLFVRWVFWRGGGVDLRHFFSGGSFAVGFAVFEFSIGAGFGDLCCEHLFGHYSVEAATEALRGVLDVVRPGLFFLRGFTNVGTPLHEFSEKGKGAAFDMGNDQIQDAVAVGVPMGTRAFEFVPNLTQGRYGWESHEDQFSRVGVLASKGKHV